MVLTARDINGMLKAVFTAHLEEDVTVAVQPSRKQNPQVIEGWIDGVFAHGVLIKHHWQSDLDAGNLDDSSLGSEFVSYVDFYILHARVRSGLVKEDVERVLPEIKNTVLLGLRNTHSEKFEAVFTGA